MSARLTFAAVASLLATPALAHPGGHEHMTFLELVQHVAQPDHLALLALIVIVGWLAFRSGRRIEAKAKAAARPQKEQRP